MQILNKLILSLSDNPKQIKDAGERLAKSAKAKSDAIIALNHEEVKVLRSEQEKLPEQREKERLTCQVRGEKKLQKKASTYRFSAMLLSYASLILSVSGASGTNAILNFGETIRNPFAIAVFVLQTTLLGYYSSENQVKQLYKGTHMKMSVFQYMIIAVSVYCNYIYLNMLIGTPLVSLVLAVAFDFGSIAFSQLATVVKYRMIDLELGEPGLLYQLLVVLTHPVTNSIRSRYDAIKQTSKPEVNLDKQGVSEVDSLLDKVIDKARKLEPNSVVNKDTFELDLITWQKARDELKKRGIVRCEDKKTYINPSLADAARELLENL